MFLSARGLPARAADGRLSPRALNLILVRIGRWHDAEITDPERQISPLRPHDLRHTFAFTLAAATGADAYELERRLGHRSQRYIQRYTNPPDEVAAGYVEAPLTMAIARHLTEAQRQEAMARFALLRPALEDGVPLATGRTCAGYSLPNGQALGAPVPATRPGRVGAPAPQRPRRASSCPTSSCSSSKAWRCAARRPAWRASTGKRPG